MKQIISNYTFNKTAKTITLLDFGAVQLGRLLLVTNVSHGKVIYQFNNSDLGATVSGNTVTLNYDTSSMSNADMLQIFYDTQDGDPVYEPPSPVNQGDLSDELDTVAIRGIHNVFTGYGANTASTLIATLDVRKYSTMVVKLTGTWVATVQFEYSLDGISFNAYNAVGTNGAYVLPRIGGYFRATAISYTSGTVMASLQLYAAPIQIGAGNVAVATPPHAVFVGMRNNLGNLAGLESASSVGDGGSGNGLVAMEGFGFNGINHDRTRFANVIKTVSANAVGDTAVWTPATGKRFRLMGYSLDVTADAAKASAGILTIKLRDAAADLGIAYDVFIPSVPGEVMAGGFRSGFVPLSNGKLSSAVNNNLHVQLSAALTSGVVRVNIVGMEE